MKPGRPDKKSDTIKFRVPWSLKRDFMERARREGRPASDIFRDLMEDYLRRPAQRTATQTLETAMTTVRRHPRRAGFAAVIGAAGISALIAGALPAGAAPDLRPAFESMDANSDGVIDASEYGRTIIQVTADAMNAGGSDGPSARPGWTIYAGDPSLRVELSAEPLAQRGSFPSFDMDGDGRISLDEWQAHFAEATDRVSAALDDDGNDVLDPSESPLNELDDDRDGHISRREFSAALVLIPDAF